MNLLDSQGDCPGQTIMHFTAEWKAEDMGHVLMGRCILLRDSFISEELGLSSMTPIGEITSVACPFCHKGFLRLKGIIPEHSRGSGGIGTLYHVGDKYELDCSAECKASFIGSVTWMHID